MQVDAIYENGQVRIITPVRLKNHVIRLRIDIPDDEIEQDPKAESDGARMMGQRGTGNFSEELMAALAPLREYLKSDANRPLSKAEVRDLAGDAWDEKHRG